MKSKVWGGASCRVVVRRGASKQVRLYDSWQAGLESLVLWVILCHAERLLRSELIVGKDEE